MKFQFRDLWDQEDVRTIQEIFGSLPDTFEMECSRPNGEYFLMVRRGSGHFFIQGGKIPADELRLHKTAMIKKFTEERLTIPENQPTTGIYELLRLRTLDMEMQGDSREKIEAFQSYVMEDEERRLLTPPEPHPEDFVARPALLVKDGNVEGTGLPE